MSKDTEEMERAVKDYVAGMGRFLGLNAQQMQVLGDRYRRGLQNFEDSLTAEAQASGANISKVKAKARRITQ